MPSPAKREYLYIIVLYSLAYGLILLNRGLFLDDSVITGFMTNPDDLIGIYKEAGSFLYWPAYTHSFFFLLGDQTGIFLERLAIFLAYLASALLLFRTLGYIKEIAPTERLFIGIIFAVLSVNISRICISNMTYLCSLAFFVGLALLSAYFTNRKLVFRAAALAAFFFSFMTYSILVFFITALLLIAYFERERITGLSSLVRLGVRYLDFIMLPVIFWTVKSAFFVPYGAHSQYYSIKIGRASGVFEKIMRELSMPPFIIENSLFIQAAVIIALIVLLIFFRRAIMLCFKNRRSESLFFIAGLVILAAALLPYMMVGKFPRPFSYADRHSLLVPLGAAFTLYYGVKLLFGSWRPAFVPALISIFVIIFVYVNINSFSSFQRQYYKQISLIENIRLSDTIRENDTFIFVDETKGYNGFPGEVYRQYEWTWLFISAFGDEKRIGWSGTPGYCRGIIEYESIGHFRPEKKREMRFGDYTPGPPQYIVTVREGARSLHGFGGLAAFMAMDLSGSLRGSQALREIVSLSYSKLPDGIDICKGILPSGQGL